MDRQSVGVVGIQQYRERRKHRARERDEHEELPFRN